MSHDLQWYMIFIQRCAFSVPELWGGDPIENTHELDKIIYIYHPKSREILFITCLTT